MATLLIYLEPLCCKSPVKASLLVALAIEQHFFFLLSTNSECLLGQGLYPVPSDNCNPAVSSLQPCWRSEPRRAFPECGNVGTIGVLHHSKAAVVTGTHNSKYCWLFFLNHLNVFHICVYHFSFTHFNLLCILFSIFSYQIKEVTIFSKSQFLGLLIFPFETFWVQEVLPLFIFPSLFLPRNCSHPSSQR